jgi:hypothetical protein
MSKDLQDVVRVIFHALGKDASLYDQSFLQKSLKSRWEKNLNHDCRGISPIPVGKHGGGRSIFPLSEYHL